MRTTLRHCSTVVILCVAEITHTLAKANDVYRERTSHNATGGALVYVPTPNPNSDQSH